MTAILGRIGNLVGFTTGRGTTPWDTEMEVALRKMDAMLASTVVAITNTLPGSANEGDLYLVGTSPTGVAAGWANRIARWRSSPAGWEAYQPMQGWIITIVGESTNKIRRYNGTAWVALAADTGAEPYAGVPAQTSFWRSTAAGVRAWVQLVAADITDLATTLAGYLTKLNPTYTGRLTGPTQYLEADEQILLAIRRPGGNSGRIHGIAFQAQNDASAWVEFGRAMAYISSVTAGAHTGGMRLMAYKGGAIVQALDAGPDAVRVGAGLPLQMEFTTVIDASRNITGTTIKGGNLTGTGNRPLVAGADGTIGNQDAATFRGTIGALASTNPHFIGYLYQDGNQRITPDGIGRFNQLIVDTLASDNLPTVTDAIGVLRNKSPAEFRTIIAAAAANHNHFSKLVVSASTSLGGISASAIYIPATDVNLTLDGGVDGQAWDIYSASSFGLVVPSGTSLYAYNGIDTGPTTRPVGGGRAIRVVRLTATIWLVPNMSW